MKGRYYLDEIDKTRSSTNSYTIWNTYRNMFYEDITPKEPDYIPGEPPDWDIITDNGKVIFGSEDGKLYILD